MLLLTSRGKIGFHLCVFKAVDDVFDYLDAFHYNASLIICRNYKKVYSYCAFFLKFQDMNSYKELVKLCGYWASFCLPCVKAVIEFCLRDRSGK